MNVVQIATRIDEIDYRQFETISRQIGTTPTNALRMLISAFNRAKGFPYQLRLIKPRVEAFTNEEEATEFVSELSRKTINETR